ncbi:MAG: hypothetical protein VXW25_05995 [Pseudomonadota bacterium]|nr:hypothetical protein [Pseudomonadota bacterium]
MRSLSTYVATALLSVSLAAPVTALAQSRIAVATLDGDTIWLDEIMAVADTLPPEYQQQGIAGIYDQLIDEVANSRLAAVAAREPRVAVVVAEVHVALGDQADAVP